MDGSTPDVAVTLINLLAGIVTSSNPLSFVLTTALTVLTTYGIGYLRRKTGIAKQEEDAKIRSYLHDAVDNAIKYAVAQRDDISTFGSTVQSRKDLLTSTAVNYLVKQVPDAVEHFKMDNDNLFSLVEVGIRRLFDDNKKENEKKGKKNA